jgi:hypothetical protein
VKKSCVSLTKDERVDKVPYKYMPKGPEVFQNEVLRRISGPNVKEVPADGVSTLSWWWGLSAPETLRAMPAVA